MSTDIKFSIYQSKVNINIFLKIAQNFLALRKGSRQKIN
jgi:hypothetical protein